MTYLGRHMDPGPPPPHPVSCGWDILLSQEPLGGVGLDQGLGAQTWFMAPWLGKSEN